jgi:amino acid adenylation domain-containing protein
VGAEVKVGICVERSLEMLVGILGILKAGGAYVPLDPNYPVERRRYMVKDAGLKLLLTQEELGAECAEAGIEVICIDGVGKDRERVGQESKANPVAVAGPGNLAYVIYTSGSTGRPKGVGITHSNCVGLLHWAEEVFDRDALSGVLASTSMCFDLSVFEFFVPLSCGGSVIVAENALSLPLLPAADEVTLVNTVPSVFAELLEVGGVPGSVRVVNLAGEALRRRLVEETHGLKSVEQVWNLYGPTEGTTYSTYVCMGREREEEKEPTIGVPIANTQVYVLDERMEPVAVGVVGELYIGGAGLARGYLNRPGLTGEKFVPNPFSGKRGGRLYRTGDRTRWLAEGKLEFVGRRDEQVKVRGYRIELGEIEAALLGMEEIAEAVVVVREDEPGERGLVGYVVGGEGKEADVNAIRKALQLKLPEYMVPAIVVLERMPLTVNGKIDRRALPAAEGTRGGSYEAPRTAEEEVLAGIWAQVLEVERVGIDDNFFELGGHSLLAMRVMSRIREAFQVEMPLRVLFEAPTVRGLAEQVEVARRAGQGLEVPRIERADRDERIPLSYAQQRLWFLDQLDPGSALYNVYVGYRMKGELDREALE